MLPVESSDTDADARDQDLASNYLVNYRPGNIYETGFNQREYEAYPSSYAGVGVGRNSGGVELGPPSTFGRPPNSFAPNPNATLTTPSATGTSTFARTGTGARRPMPVVALEDLDALYG